MKHLLKKRTLPVLLAMLYVVWTVALLCVQLFGFARAQALRADGTLPQQTLTVADFELYDLELRGDVLVVTGADPRMELRDESLLADSLLFEASYSQEPGPVTALWAQPAQDHSLRRVAYAQPQQGASLFYLPAGGGARLRIDPGTRPGTEIRVIRIVANPPRSLGSYLVPGPARLLGLAVGPALLACAVTVAGCGLAALHRRKVGGAPC